MSQSTFSLKGEAAYTAHCTLTVGDTESTFNLMAGQQHSNVVGEDDDVLLSMKPMGATHHTSAVTWPSNGVPAPLDGSVSLAFRGTVNNPFIEQQD